MATSTYPLVIPKVLAHEGGYVNHPKDPGGATNKGVTQGTYNGYRDRKGRPRQSVRLMSADEVAEIYRRDYWDKVRGDDLPAGTDYATFDAGVNSGPKRAATWLQQLAGAPVDGAIGPVTVQTVRAYAAGQAALVKAYCRRRLSFMQSLKIWSTFGKGWARRVAEVEAYAVKLALAAVPAKTPTEVKRELAAEAGEAQKEANADATKSGGAIVVGGGSTQAERVVEPEALPEIPVDPALIRVVLIGFAVGLAIAAIVFAMRWWINRARAKAYEQEARRP